MGFVVKPASNSHRKRVESHRMEQGSELGTAARFHPSTLEADGWISVSLRLAWSAEHIPGQPGLHRPCLRIKARKQNGSVCPSLNTTLWLISKHSGPAPGAGQDMDFAASHLQVLIHTVSLPLDTFSASAQHFLNCTACTEGRET